MSLLFVDANVYLACFSSEGQAITKLLPTLQQQRAHLLVTEQVASEVLRNKAKLVARFFDNYIELVTSTKKLDLPTQFIPTDCHEAIEDWKNKSSVSASRQRETRNDLRALKTKIVSLVAASKDPVSLQLQTLFDQAVSPSDAELAAARTRKELGNPPGKFNDPLGDQVSWEQVLSRVDRWGGAAYGSSPRTTTSLLPRECSISIRSS